MHFLLWCCACCGACSASTTPITSDEPVLACSFAFSDWFLTKRTRRSQKHCFLVSSCAAVPVAEVSGAAAAVAVVQSSGPAATSAVTPEAPPFWRAQLGQKKCGTSCGCMCLQVMGGKIEIHKTAGWVFGDTALLFQSPRSASIVASTAIELWAMDRRTFHKVSCITQTPLPPPTPTPISIPTLCLLYLSLYSCQLQVSLHSA